MLIGAGLLALAVVFTVRTYNDFVQRRLRTDEAGPRSTSSSNAATISFPTSSRRSRAYMGSSRTCSRV